MGGPSGSGIKVNSDNFEARTAADDGYVIIRAATPVDSNDLVTKAYTDTKDAVIQVEVDFGIIPTRYKVFTITDVNVLLSSNLIFSQSGKAPTGKSIDENEMDMFVFSATPKSGSFSLIATALNGPVVGKFKLNYVIG